MAFKIKTKTGTSAPASGVLDVGELGFDTTNKKLYVGNGTGQPATQIGSSYSLPLSANGTRGGIQIGATETETNRAVILTSEKASVALPRQIPAVTLNGSTATAPSFYAPTTVGISGQIATSTGSGTPSYAYNNKAYFLASNFTNSTTTLNPVTGLSFTMQAGKKYHVRFLGTFESVTATTGCMFGVNLGTGGVATVRGYAQGEITASTLASGLRSAIYAVTTAQPAGSYITATGTSAPSTYQALEMDLAIQCTSSGDIRIVFASEIASSLATLHAGACMIVDELNT